MVLAPLSRLIEPVPVPVRDETLLEALELRAAVPPLKLRVSPPVAERAEVLVWVITLPDVVDAVRDMAPEPVTASLSAIEEPARVNAPTLVPAVPVVIAPA